MEQQQQQQQIVPHSDANTTTTTTTNAGASVESNGHGGFDITNLFKTVSVLTQQITSDLKPKEGGDQNQEPPDIGKIFASIGKVLSEPNNSEVNNLKNTFSGIKLPTAPPNTPTNDDSTSSSSSSSPLLGGLDFGKLFSSLMVPPQPPSSQVQASHQNQEQQLQELEQPLHPISEKTVVLEVTQQDLVDEVIKKFTIDVAERNTKPDVFKLELPLEKNKTYYKFFLKERNLNLIFHLDVV